MDVKKTTNDIDKSIEWIFKKLRRPPFLWHLASSLTIATVGFLSKVITGNFSEISLYFIHSVCVCFALLFIYLN